MEFSWNITSNQPGPLGGTLVKPWWNPRGTFPGPRRRNWNPGGTLVRSTTGWWNPGETWWNPRGTLPQTTSDHPAALAEPGETLAGGNLVETTPDHPAALVNPRGTLPQIEPSWNLTSNHPRPPRPCRTWWNPGGTLVEPWWNLGGTLGEPWWNPWWNPGGTLGQGRPEPPRSLSGLRPQSFQLLGKNVS